MRYPARLLFSSSICFLLFPLPHFTLPSKLEADTRLGKRRLGHFPLTSSAGDLKETRSIETFGLFNNPGLFLKLG
jgi:hypothetical protein